MRIAAISVIAMGWFVGGMLIGQTKPAPEVDKTDLMLAEAERAQINELLTNWHNAASRSDYDGYFNPLDEHAVYLGTDATERWTKSEFSTFCKPHFARKNGWSFKAVSRHIMFDSPTGHQKTAVTSLSKSPTSSDEKSTPAVGAAKAGTAEQAKPASSENSSVTKSASLTRSYPLGMVCWFDEELATPNLGPARGSGVLIKRQTGWKILHYNLTITVPNDRFKGVKALLDQPPAKK